jgi:hypothetical protein
MSEMLPTASPEPAAGLQPATAVIDPTVRPEDVAPDRAANVQRILSNIQAAKQHFKADFARMRSDMDFASGLQYADQASYDDDRYRLNLVLRHIRLRTATLYAKNPKAVYRRRAKMDFALWDEKPESLMMAMQQVAMAQQATAQIGHNGGPPMDPAALLPPTVTMLLEDYQQGMQRRMMAEKLGRTQELLWEWFITEPVPNIKAQMKAMVRRAVTCGVGYMKLGFQRQMQPRPDQATKIADLTQQLSVIERLRSQVMGKDAVATEYGAQAEELRQAIKSLQEQPEMVLREGPILDFPRSTALIPDPRTRSLRGWIGASWVAEEFELTRDQVEEIYGVRVTTASERGRDNDVHSTVPLGHEPDTVRFWQYYCKTTARLYTVAQGWPDYLEEPRAPDVDLERFFPYYALSFNEIEHEKRLFPPSDVELLRSPQDEYNRNREGLRQHRIANRPLYAAANGAFDEKDVTNLSRYSAHAVVTLNNLKEGQNVAELLQPVAKVPIDPAVYEVEGLFSDTLRATGSQEANFGGASGATATEVAEASRSGASTTVSDTDDQDETLTDLARDFGVVCLMNMSAETVKALVGPGAVWPTLTKAEIMAEGVLEVEVGSSGRPNRERDLANFERAMPFLIQLPGIKPSKLAEYGLRLLDDKIDMAMFLDESLPSITAMNSAKQPGTGDPATDPNAQGAQGGDNAARPGETAGGSQPAYGPSGNDVGGG